MCSKISAMPITSNVIIVAMPKRVKICILEVFIKHVQLKLSLNQAAKDLIGTQVREIEGCSLSRGQSYVVDS